MGGIRIALAQYRELAAFSQFLSDLDEATRQQLERGQRITEVMKQKQYQPLSVADMALILYAASEGDLDYLPLTKIADFEQGLLGHARANYFDFMNKINETGDYSNDIVNTLKIIIAEFKKIYL